MTKFQVSEIEEPGEREISVLIDGINEYAKKARGLEPTKSCYLAIKDEKGMILGGTFGHNIFGGLHIDILWVTEALRGQGYGSELLEKLEKWARDQGCAFSCLFTMNWEAREFYENHGYTVEFERDGYANDAKAICLIKRF